VTHHGPTWYYCHLTSSYVRILTYFCVCGTAPTSTHCTASTGVGRGPTGCHISFPWTEIFTGYRNFLAHGWEGVLACKGVLQGLALSDGLLVLRMLVWILGAILRFFHVGSLHTVLFRNQRLASREKCIMTDFVRRVFEDIFVCCVC